MGVSDLSHTFDFIKISDAIKPVYDAFNGFVENEKPFLFCYGGVGNGKTLMLEATAQKIYNAGGFARVVRTADMYGAMKNALRNRDSMPRFDSILNNYMSARWLLLDDLSMGHTGTEWESSILEQIVCHRYHERLKTAITSNSDIKDLPERVLSRFRDTDLSVIVLNKAPDYRVRK